MLPSLKERVVAPDFEGLSVNMLDEWRNDDLNMSMWRYTAAEEEEYADGNMYSDGDLRALQANGIPAITIDRIGHQLDAVSGLMESNLTDLKISSEEVNLQDATDAMNVKLHEAVRISDFTRTNIKAGKSASKAGIGWLEIGRNRDPFRSRYKAQEIPWREMYWNLRFTNMEDMDRVRRVRFHFIDRLVSAFPDKEKEIRQTAWTNDTMRMWIEPDRLHRQYERQNWRDVPLSWNYSAQSQRDMRLLEEVFYQVQLEGPVVKLPNDRVIAYDDCCDNPMVELALKSGVAELEMAAYSRWRRSFWINQTCLRDEWSPLPFNACPYTPIFCYRESMTGVPYGLVRRMRSIQDAINTMEAKMMLSLSAVKVMFEKGAIDPELWGVMVNRKNALLPVEAGYMEKVKILDNLALNSQHFQLYQDLLQQIEITTGISGLNPSAMQGKPRSGVLAQQMIMQAMSTLGEFSANCRDARLRSGRQLLELVREDIAKKGSVNVTVKHRTGGKTRVMLHAPAGEHQGCKLISNDVTLLNAEVAMEEVPHTATYRAAQLDNIAMALQSLPPNDPSTMAVRLLLTAKMIECMDVPNAAEDAQLIREKSGLAPPSNPQEAAQAQMQAQQAQEQHQLTVQGALAQIRLTNARAGEHDAKAAHANALAQAESQPDPVGDASKVVDLDKKRAQVAQILGKTSHTAASTVLALHKADGQAQDNAQGAMPEQQEQPQQGW
jgi:hypothetical protein